MSGWSSIQKAHYSLSIRSKNDFTNTLSYKCYTSWLIENMNVYDRIGTRVPASYQQNEKTHYSKKLTLSQLHTLTFHQLEISSPQLFLTAVCMHKSYNQNKAKIFRIYCFISIIDALHQLLRTKHLNVCIMLFSLLFLYPFSYCKNTIFLRNFLL